MPAWLTLVIIVLLSVALFVDHRRNVVAELTDVGEVDVGPTGRRAVTRPATRADRGNGRPAHTRRSHTQPVRRGDRSSQRR